MSIQIHTTSKFDLSVSSKPSGELARVLLELMRNMGLSLDDGVTQMFIGRAAALLEPPTEFRSFDTVAEFARGGLAPWQQRKISSYIRENLDKSLQTWQLAAEVNLSASHFTRAFKASFGLVPSTYMMKMRIERAQQLMLQTKDPICQIALDCGFSDQAHLSKRFRKEVCDTPHHWRRLHSRGDLDLKAA
jgi:AraC family transcriptional regulator